MSQVSLPLPAEEVREDEIKDLIGDVVVSESEASADNKDPGPSVTNKTPSRRSAAYDYFTQDPKTLQWKCKVGCCR